MFGIRWKCRIYFLTNCECNGCFGFICGYVLTSGIGGEWSSGSQTSLTGCGHRNLYFLFRSRLYFRFDLPLIPRPSRARDLVTMAEVGSARLPLFERVTMGVGSVSRGARVKPNWLGRSLRPSFPGGAVSVTFYPNSQFTVRKCRITLVLICATTNAVFRLRG